MLLKNNIDEIKNILNSNSILTSEEECYCYATDAINFDSKQTTPDIVVFAENISDVQKIVKYANENKIPIISRGAGTNMVGACTCSQGGIILNFSKMNKIIDLDAESMTIKVEPGVLLGDIKASAVAAGLFFPPDPSNYNVSTIAGAISQSSGGALSFKYGTIKDYVLSLKIVTATGELVTLGHGVTKDSTGYHLTQLMVGSEGTLGIIVEATLKLIPKPQCNNVIVAYFNSIDTAVSTVNSVTSSGIFPAAIEFMDKNAVITVESYIPSKFKTDYECVILIELDGDKKSIELQTQAVAEILEKSGASKIYVPPTKKDYDRIWKARQSSFAAATRLAPDVISDDIIVPRKNLGEMVKKCNDISRKYNLKMCLVGHIGDGNLHPQIVFNAENDDEFKNYINARDEIYKCCADLDGTISAEHGIGLEKRPYLNNFADKYAINYMKSIKQIFDPNNILNPDKIFKTDKE